MRYRKTYLRLESDEKLALLGPMADYLWRMLLSHPNLTPMGAGMIDPGLLDYKLGHYGGHPWSGIEIYRAEYLLGQMEKKGMLLRDGHLVIIRNFLLYNRIDNQNLTASWISCCEELPVSPIFVELRDHLKRKDETAEWVFWVLLDPMAEGDRTQLKSLFYERLKGAQAAAVPENVVYPEFRQEEVVHDSKKPSPKILFDVYREANRDLPQPEDFTPDRRKKCATRLSKAEPMAWVEKFKAAVSKAQASDFLRGRTAKSDWKADFDWFIKNDTNIVRVLEGKYDNRSGPSGVMAKNLEAARRFVERGRP